MEIYKKEPKKYLSAHLNIMEVDESPIRGLKIFSVIVSSTKQDVGCIKFSHGLEIYCFFPNENLFFGANILYEVIEALEQINKDFTHTKDYLRTTDNDVVRM